MPVSGRRVPASWPDGARIAFLGEGPGADEDKYLKPFIGKSGKVLWEMVGDYTGLSRDSVYVDNLSQYRLTDNRGKDRAPTDAEALVLAPQLRQRIAEVNPELIVTLGRYSTAAMLRTDRPMEVCHGRLYHTRKGRPLFPCFHPAAGLHDPTLLAFTSHDLQAVGAYLRGDEAGYLTAKGDAHPRPWYEHAPFKGKGRMDPGPEVAIDTEYDPVTREPWCLTWSDTPGIAHFIRADDLNSLRAFREGLAFNEPAILLHNSMADLAPLRKMGIDLIAMGLKIRDTMIELFLTQLNPRGLKQSSARLCGMAMRDYEEVVGPVAEKFARDYLLGAISEPPAEWGIGEGRKHSVLKRIEGMVYPRPTQGEPKTLREKWADPDFSHIRSMIEKTQGEMPRPTLDDMPPDFVDYACADADGTYRQGTILLPLMTDLNLREVHKVDHDIIPIVERMQQVGLRVDTKRLDELRDYVQGELDAYLEICQVLTGREGFNPGSGDQVEKFCEEEGLGLTKWTKGGEEEAG